MTEFGKLPTIVNDRAFEHDKALAHIEAFEQASSSERDTTELFKNLDHLRRMQIDIALEHLALGKQSSERLSALDVNPDEDSTRRYKRNAERFAKREAEVNGLMSRLEELSESMRNFHDSMDLLRAGASGNPTSAAPSGTTAAGAAGGTGTARADTDGSPRGGV
ncbi:uncharacterized protein EV422DRAFT_535855 [Fimicolochytrium jonesii]|uniref:uncharacterized protein n=1 Tax=Fimicolochytrium jonesii TaxID=1396493 RepID=UPI0022FE54CB|nr:uncharacterized protein EV422DRAFT_535855 [Fimicolochytrium jonesii]KAI8818900.1 hypothetical protein EV422DRAFT_535855 [Fimicolochytrium jonesii]